MTRRWARSLAALGVVLTLTLVWPPLYVFACALTGLQAYQPTLAETALTMERAALSQLGDPYPSLPPLEKGYPDSTSVQAPTPCVLLKSIGYIEASWRQTHRPTKEGQTGPALMSSSCGYGIMQITSGMRNPGELPADTQHSIASDYRYNIAWGAKTLAHKWNAMGYFNAVVGDRDPSIAGNWYYSVWAYNQFNFRNNPHNPDFPWPRAPYYHSQNRLNYPYQELVWGLASRPPDSNGKPLWEAVALTLPNRAEVGQTPGPLPPPAEQASGACLSFWADHAAISWNTGNGPLTPQTITLASAAGPSNTAWSAATANAPWIHLQPNAGDSLPVEVTISANPRGLAPGTHRAALVFTSDGISPLTLPIEVIVDGQANRYQRYFPYIPRRAILPPGGLTPLGRNSNNTAERGQGPRAP